MFLNRSSLNTSLQGLVGAHQTVNPSYPQLASSLLVSRSGRYWQDEFPSLLTIDNIYECFTNYSHFNYDAYSASTEYSQYDKVQSGGVNYEYINSTPSTGNTPPNATYWRVIDELSDYLLQLDYKSTDLTLDSLINLKKIKGQVKSIFNNAHLYSGRDVYSTTEANTGKFVGLKLTFKDHRGLVTILHRFGHQFDGALNDVNLYLYHTSQQAAIATFTFSHTTAKTSQWTSLSNQILRYVSDNYDVGGSYYLGYYQDDLGSVKAVKKDVIWNVYKPCCDNKRDYRQYSKFIDVVGVSFQADALNGTGLPDIEKEIVDYFSNYGLNLEFTTKCDLSPFIIQQEELIAEVKSLNMAFLVMQDMAYNTRGSNSQANQVKQMAKNQLFHVQGVYGNLYDRLEAAKKALDFDISGLNTACIPCNDAFNVSFGSY